MTRFLKTRTFRILLLGAGIGIVGFSASAKLFVMTSSTEFCLSCHEMLIVAEQGWMTSPHYDNPHGVVAGCADCHVEPELVPMIWTKTRDGLNDIWVHLTGESNPHEMDWRRLREVAVEHSSDSACRSCHGNLEPRGASLKMLVAHREYQRLEGRKKCVNCHTEEFHGDFRRYLHGTARVVSKEDGR